MKKYRFGTACAVSIWVSAGACAQIAPPTAATQVAQTMPVAPQAVPALSQPAAAPTAAAPAIPKEWNLQSGEWVAKSFRFHTGQEMDELKLHYRTLGNPEGEPVLILHGTSGSGAAMLAPSFAGELFGQGQPLDLTKYFVILPDALGHGQSSKPSDGKGPDFPQYDYEDMVRAQYRLLTEGLGLTHLRLVLGFSMGGMQTWLWAENYPGFADALVPMASLPTQVSGRNWMTRRMLVDIIKADPAYKDGHYTEQPPSLKWASAFFNLTTNGGSLAYAKSAPTREAADQAVAARLAAPVKFDANDYIYQWSSAADYNPAPGLSRISAPLLAINSADDERNPPELGVLEPSIASIPGAKFYLIPASATTGGHGTVMQAALWKAQLVKLLSTAPHKAP